MDYYLYIKIIQYVCSVRLYIITKCYNNFFKTWHEEYKHWAEDEDAIREKLHHNQYEDQLYYENGEAYAGPLNKIE